MAQSCNLRVENLVYTLKELQNGEQKQSGSRYNVRIELDLDLDI